MTKLFPDVCQKFEVANEARVQMNRTWLSVISSTPLESFLTQGLMEAQNLLLLDLNSCTRCDACVLACADAHDGVTRLVREGLRFDHYLVATSCRQCLDPLCMVGCPGGIDSPQEFAGSDHRRLVHRLRPLC
jgi:ferredoxin